MEFRYGCFPCRYEEVWLCFARRVMPSFMLPGSVGVTQAQDVDFGLPDGSFGSTM